MQVYGAQIIRFNIAVLMDAFRVTLAVTKVDSLLRATSVACRDGRHHFSRRRSGGNRATRVGEVFRSKVSLRQGCLKISRDPLGTFS